MDYFSGADIGTGFDPNQIVGWGSGEEQNSSVQQVQQATQMFRQQFQNLIGRAPTAQELGQFQTQALQGAVNAPGDLSYGDESGLANSFINNTFGPQVVQNQQAQATSQLQSSQNQIQNLINQTMGNTSKALSDPNSQIYQQLAGSMNNMGITPSSGAFQAGAGSTIANSGLNAANAGLEAIGIPGIQNIANMQQQPYQQSIQSGGQALGNLENINNFGLEQQIAQMLSNQSQPSTAMKDIGMASGAANALGGLGQGIAGGSQLTSYVCMELVHRGLAQKSDLDLLHWAVMPAVFKKGRAFWHYAKNAKALVEAVNKAGIDWRVHRNALIDNVVSAPTALEAVNRYETELHLLALLSGFEWDARVQREGILDSLLFLPLLITYKPFVKAFLKAMRMRFLVLLDLPVSEMN